MFVTELTIQNFRSIGKQQTLKFKKIGGSECFILLGINESGKSNVLRAISLLDTATPVPYNLDCQTNAEEAGGKIEFRFKLETSNPDYFRKRLVAAGLDKTLGDAVTFERVYRHISVGKDGRTDDAAIELPKLSDSSLEKYLVVDGKIVPRQLELEQRAEDGSTTNVATREYFEAFVTNVLGEAFKSNSPRVIVWRSTAEYRITERINLDSFKTEPTSSIPLRNCFRIAGFETNDLIRARIESAIGNPSKTAALAQLLGRSVTSHINEIWPEHRVSIKFHIDGSLISFLVEDKDNDAPKFEVEQRSDGFKHFISILLNLSAENRAQTLANNIILLDEPETHLHPSGQRFLRDELLRIAKTNVVVFATHSIFMVDTKHLDRHFSVRKRSGMTEVIPIEKDNPYREEVLFEALGTSVLQLIEPNVIVFEGKTDRDIFDLYVRKLSDKIDAPKVTAISGDGANEIIKFTKFLNTKLVKGFVVVDSDADGRRVKERVLAEPRYNKKNTFELNELVDLGKDTTVEDFFDRELLTKCVRDEFEVEILLDERAPFIAQIKKLLHEAEKPYRDAEKEKLKQAFFAGIAKLTKAELEAQPYLKFAQSLCKAVSG